MADLAGLTGRKRKGKKMKKYALVENVDGELTQRLFKTFKEAAEEVLDYMVSEILTEEEHKALKTMLGNDYNMTDYFNDQDGEFEIYVNQAHEAVEIWHNRHMQYMARLFVIEEED